METRKELVSPRGTPPRGPARIQVAVLARNPIFRAGIVEIVTSAFGEAVHCTRATTLEAPLNCLHWADLVVADLSVCDCTDNLLAVLSFHKPCPPVVAFGSLDGGQGAAKLLKGGVSAFLTRDANLEEVVEAVRVAATGGRYLNRGVGAHGAWEQILCGGKGTSGSRPAAVGKATGEPS